MSISYVIQRKVIDLSIINSKRIFTGRLHLLYEEGVFLSSSDVNKKFNDLSINTFFQRYPNDYDLYSIRNIDYIMSLMKDKFHITKYHIDDVENYISNMVEFHPSHVERFINSLSEEEKDLFYKAHGVLYYEITPMKINHFLS